MRSGDGECAEVLGLDILEYSATMWVRARVASSKNAPEFGQRCLIKMLPTADPRPTARGCVWEFDVCVFDGVLR